MITGLKMKFRKSLLLRKGIVTILIMVVYLFGRNVALPHLVITNKGLDEMLQLASITTGGDMASNSVFSLGLTPWMTAVIIMSLFTTRQDSTFAKKSQKEQSMWQMLLALVLGVLQGLVKIIETDFEVPGLGPKLAALVVLLGGSFFVVWLASMNTQFGVGGAGAIFMSNIVMANGKMLGPGISYVLKHRQLLWPALIGGTLIIVLIIMVAVIFDRSEYRMPLKRVMVTNEYGNDIYLPIKTAPAGAMPVMFGMALVTLPQYFCQLLLVIWPDSKILNWLTTNLVINSALGTVAYIISLLALSLAFAYVNINPEDTAEGLQKSGDYITGIAYGDETKKYIAHYMWHMGILGGLYMAVIAGCPLILGLYYPELQRMVLLPGNLMLNTTFFLVIIDQIRTLRLATRYTKILD